MGRYVGKDGTVGGVSGWVTCYDMICIVRDTARAGGGGEIVTGGDRK